jgi:hypothetical protein
MTTLKPRTKGDTAYPPTITCLADGAPVDLTGMTVTLRMEAGNLTKHPAHTLSNQSTHKGQLVPIFIDEDVDTTGLWAIRVHAVLADGTIATFRGIFLPIVD